MTKIDKVLYTGKTHTTGGRDGASHSDDGQLDIKLSPPGSNRAGTNPEQLFAAGWSACFIGAIGFAAANQRSSFQPILLSTPRSIWEQPMAAISCRPVSRSACRGSKRMWHEPSLRRLTRPVPIRRPRAAISMSN